MFQRISYATLIWSNSGFCLYFLKTLEWTRTAPWYHLQLNPGVCHRCRSRYSTTVLLRDTQGRTCSICLYLELSTRLRTQLHLESDKSHWELGNTAGLACGTFPSLLAARSVISAARGYGAPRVLLMLSRLLVQSTTSHASLKHIMALKTFDFVVHGRVQGVGFRHFVATTARADGIVGWVKNHSVCYSPSSNALCSEAMW